MNELETAEKALLWEKSAKIWADAVPMPEQGNIAIATIEGTDQMCLVRHSPSQEGYVDFCLVFPNDEGNEQLKTRRSTKPVAVEDIGLVLHIGSFPSRQATWYEATPNDLPITNPWEQSFAA